MRAIALDGASALRSTDQSKHSQSPARKSRRTVSTPFWRSEILRVSDRPCSARQYTAVISRRSPHSQNPRITDSPPLHLSDGRLNILIAVRPKEIVMGKLT